MLYGSKYVSSFEIARGIHASLEGSGQKLLPPEVLEAQAEMNSNRVLFRVLKSKGSGVNYQNLKNGDSAFALVPGEPRKRGH